MSKTTNRLIHVANEGSVELIAGLGEFTSYARVYDQSEHIKGYRLMYTSVPVMYPFVVASIRNIRGEEIWRRGYQSLGAARAAAKRKLAQMLRGKHGDQQK
jgi:hypothetical protein